jgi:hypothetical protein
MQAITIVREPDASDERVKEVYRDIKESLRISFVHSMFQAYASNPKFLDYTWRRLRPSMLAQPFVEQARKLGEMADEGIESWAIGDHAAALHTRNYGDNELRKLREIVALFHSVDPKLLIIANAVRIALTGEPIGGVGSPHPPQHIDRDKLVRDFRGLAVPLTEEREAPLRVRAIFEDMQRATKLPFVATEYRAIGSYPDWFEIFWSDRKPMTSDPRRVDLLARVSQAAQDAARQLPYPLNVPADAFSDMVEVNEAFCGLLPAVVVDIAIARRGIGAEPPTEY